MNTQPEAVDVLAVGAHPDDIELTCGGLLLKLQRAGRRLGLVDLTRGEMGTRGTPEQRHDEALAAARVLGARFRVTLDLGDGFVKVTDDGIAQVAAILRVARPAFVFACYFEDEHPDHAYGGRLVTEAVHRAGKKRYAAPGVPAAAHAVRRILYYMGRRPAFAPTFIADVSAEFAAKKEAAWCYRSQHHDPARPEADGTFIGAAAFERYWEARHAYWGAMIGAACGEPYWLPTPPPLVDPFLLWPG